MAPRRSRCRVCRGAGEGAGGLRALDECARGLLRDCLQLQLDDDTASESVLCDNCSLKLETFYEFKQLALESDEYFNNVPSEPEDLAETCWDDVFHTFEYDFYPLEDLKLLRDVKFIQNPVEKNDAIVHSLSLDELNSGLNLDPMNKPDKETKTADEQSQVSGVKDCIGKTSKTPLQTFKCPECQRRYRTLRRWAMHRKTYHNCLKPHICDYCSKAFTYTRSLQRHLRTHTKEKPYCCDACGKFFTYNTSLMLHMKSHKGIKDHKCDKCEKAFTHPSGLQAHKAKHNKTKNFQCDYCDIKFGRKDNMIAHKRRAHKINESFGLNSEQIFSKSLQDGNS